MKQYNPPRLPATDNTQMRHEESGSKKNKEMENLEVKTDTQRSLFNRRFHENGWKRLGVKMECRLEKS